MNTLPAEHGAPSRFSNPFATCWTRPGALTPLLPDGLSIDDLVERLRSHAWRGQIVGPHGSGKSTLLAALAPVARGVASAQFAVVDGLDDMNWLSRRVLLRRHRRLLATTHADAGLPTLCRMNPTRDGLQTLFARLTAARPSPVTLEDAYNQHHRCGGNIRDVWFALYLRHEQLVRGGPATAVECLQRRRGAVVWPAIFQGSSHLAR